MAGIIDYNQRMSKVLQSTIYKTPFELTALVEACHLNLLKHITMKEGREILEKRTGKSISHNGFAKKVKMLRKTLDKPEFKEIKEELERKAKSIYKDDWELNPEKYMKDEAGNFILKKDGTPKLVPGRRPNDPNSPRRGQYVRINDRTKARKVLTDDEKKARRLRRNLKRAEKRIEGKRKAYKTAEVMEGIRKTGPAVISEDEVQHLPKYIQEELETNEKAVAFRPNPGPQTDFLAAPEKDVLFGGAAGGGKSAALLVDPLRNAHNKNHRFLILRRTLGELGELIDISREMYPKAFPGAKFREQKREWTFPSGAKGFFGYLEKDSDVYQYQGRSFTWIGFDELTHLPTEFAWNYLASRLRTTDPEIETYLRCTTNPGGPGHQWVKARYLDPAPHGEPFTANGLSRRFIPSLLSDNPYLHKDGQYQKMLESLSEVERRRLLEGDWDVSDGAAFPEFQKDIHVITPMEIPPHWERIKAVDYGYAAPSAVLWGAVDPEDGTLIIYRELYEKGLDPTDLARAMHEREQGELRSIMGVIDGQCFARTGHTGPTQGEILIKAGHKLRRADKNRLAGKLQIHEYLRRREGGKPKLMITANCVNLIREMITIPLDKKNPEDVDTHAEDHAYDALRYLLMSRPRQESMYARMARYKSEKDRYRPSDPVTGY